MATVMYNYLSTHLIMDPAIEILTRETNRHRIINETIARQESPVQQFYAGAVVLVTGASGFLGKQLIEKLLRSAQVAKIYLLIRPKKNKALEERLKQMVEDPVYEYLRKSHPNFEDKLVPVKGDVSEKRLGLSQEDWTILTDEVTIIFHGAATVSFVESLKLATLTNVRGTCEMLKLGTACKKLRSYVHVSTAYSHATHKCIGESVLEKFYESPIAPKSLIGLAESFDEETLSAMTPKLIKNWPNTYAFTKAVSEEAVRTLGGDLPICIVRPAIVVSALREPSPGWIDMSSAYGPSGLILGGVLGLVQVVFVKKGVNLDLVPVDLVNNASIAAAYETAARRARGPADIKIYTVTGTRNPVNIGEIINTLKTEGSKLMSDKSIWYSLSVKTNNPLIFWLLSWLFHEIPANLADGVLWIMGKRLRLTKLYGKIKKLSDILQFYSTNDWLFGDTNLKELYWSLSPTDRVIYDCNTSSIDWKLYVILWGLGTRKYIVKDGLNNTHVGVRKQPIFKILNLFVVSLYIYAFYTILYYLIAICGAIINFYK